MRQVMIHKGTVLLENNPAPIIQKDQVIVEVAYSLISTGTEVGAVQSSNESLIKKAFDQPEKIKKLLDFIQQQGIKKTITKIDEKLDLSSPLGYSCSGKVLQVGEGIVDIQPGDLVACSGAGIANHAEIIIVPRNLMVKIPDGCTMKDAASMTLGAIAMQGVRRSDLRLGEIVCVIGLGLLGQITVQLLKASGCRVIGFDLDDRRVELARQLGADFSFNSSKVDASHEVLRITEGNGVDVTIITAASKSDSIAQLSMELTRKKGRVVVVGAVGLSLKRSPFYEKEIDFVISCSYGPGRYDTKYEKKGNDYPYAYVRWTENRNMHDYLRLIAEGKVQLGMILEREYDLSKVSQAYEELQTSSEKPLGVLLHYPENNLIEQKQKLETKVLINSSKKNGKLNIAVVGAGSFAKAVHLPNLKTLSNLYNIHAIMSNTGSNAKEVAKQYNASYASTNFQDVLDDSEVDAVIICTQHNVHAEMTLKALRANKHTLVEKPLAISQEELHEIKAFFNENTSSPVLLTGFNRRFSPHIKYISQFTDGRKSPLIINYRMNAGYIPLDHWIQNEEGGGRNIGEACHIYDLFTYLIGSKVTSVYAQSIHPENNYYSSQDNFTCTLSFEDGSVASLVYTSMGSSSYPKEKMEIFTDNIVIELDDYKSVNVFGAKAKQFTTKTMEKGHAEELRQFSEAINGGEFWPNPLWQQFQAMEIAFTVDKLIKEG